MSHNIAPFMNIIVEPGICFDGYGSEDTTELYIFRGLFMVTLNTTCYRCHEPIAATFCLGSQVSAEPAWKQETVHCRKCDVCQIKKIRYYYKVDENLRNRQLWTYLKSRRTNYE